MVADGWLDRLNRPKIDFDWSMMIRPQALESTMIQLNQQLVKQKIQALLNRRKPRDFYDIYFILRKEHMLPPQEKKVLPQILKSLGESNISFEKELTQFLPKSHWPIIKDFPSALKREIQKFI